MNSWHHGYFEYAVNFNIDGRFIPHEMARLFFLAEQGASFYNDPHMKVIPT